MEFKIIEKPEMRFVGLKKTFNSRKDLYLTKAPMFWDEFFTKDNHSKLFPLMNGTPGGFIGVCNCLGKDLIEYSIACTSDKPILEGMVEICLPAISWMVFQVTGEMPKSIQDTFDYVDKSLTSLGYTHLDLPDLEVYNQEEATDVEAEIWIPVRNN